MSGKSLVLVASAVAVLAMGVYLFVQVRSTPAQAVPADGSIASTPMTRSASRSPEAAPVTPARVEAGSAPPEVPRARPEAVAARPPPQLTTESPEVPDDRRVDLKMDTMMELANKAYDRQDFDEAAAIAGKLLSKDPTNVRMLRVMVSASCIQGDTVVAQQHYEHLPKFDREQMQRRCDRYGVTFKDPGQ